VKEGEKESAWKKARNKEDCTLDLFLKLTKEKKKGKDCSVANVV